MKDFSIVFMPEQSVVRRITITVRMQWWAMSAACLAVLVMLTSFFAMYEYGNATQELIIAQEKQDKMQRMHEQQVEYLQARLVAEQKAMSVYARELSLMQARMVRLDSLGERLVKEAALNEREFDFSQAPAFGGPRMAVMQPLPAVEFDRQLQSLAGHIGSVDAQLTVIDHVLQGARGEKEARPQAWPTDGGWLSSRYGLRNDPFTGERAMHHGVDIANRKGAPVVSTGPGIVMFAGEMPGYGYMVEVEHGYGYRSRYGHLLSVDVAVGDEVDANQLLGRVGSTGRSTGPHLHYEVHRFGRHLNPANYLPQG